MSTVLLIRGVHIPAGIRIFSECPLPKGLVRGIGRPTIMAYERRIDQVIKIVLNADRCESIFSCISQRTYSPGTDIGVNLDSMLPQGHRSSASEPGTGFGDLVAGRWYQALTAMVLLWKCPESTPQKWGRRGCYQTEFPWSTVGCWTQRAIQLVFEVVAPEQAVQTTKV